MCIPLPLNKVNFTAKFTEPSTPTIISLHVPYVHVSICIIWQGSLEVTLNVGLVLSWSGFCHMECSTKTVISCVFFVFESWQIQNLKSKRVPYNKLLTVPPKCKLPPLISFLARCVSFLSRRVSFLSRRVSNRLVTEPFSMEYITHERSSYFLLYQRFPFAVRCQIGEVEIINRKFVCFTLY